MVKFSQTFLALTAVSRKMYVSNEMCLIYKK